MRGSLKLGRLLGIPIRVHWTFGLILTYVLIQSGSGGPGAGLSLALVLAVFFCVVLHELGHAMAAAGYGIATKDIILSPIGGVARMERIPENPKQELWVAAAGPLVNVLIAAGLYVSLRLQGLEIGLEGLVVGDFGLLGSLLLVNAVLVVFNLIPAFPMDGGRMFRAILSMGMNRAKATRIAALVGQAFAVGFVVAAFYVDIFLAFIGLFVFMSARVESQSVTIQDALKKVQVKDAMVKDIALVPVASAIREVFDTFSRGIAKEFLVTDDGQRIIGVLSRPVVAKAAQLEDEEARISDLMERKYPEVSPEDTLWKVYQLMQKTGLSILPVFEQSHFEGAIGIDNVIGAFNRRRKKASVPEKSSEENPA